MKKKLEYKSHSIKDWAEEDRPREKLAQKGSAALTNAELLAILLNTGTKNRSALQIAKELLKMVSYNLLELKQLDLLEYKKIVGIGDKKAITLLAALEIGSRTNSAKALERVRISSSHEAFELLRPHFKDLTSEFCYVIYLNQANNVIDIKQVSEGGLTATVVDPRKLFHMAMQYKGVTQLILAHNHPSGNLKPSQTDIRLTEKIREAAKLMDMRLLDHLIIGQNAYFSFGDEGVVI